MAVADTSTVTTAPFPNLEVLLGTCPQSDAVYSTLRNDLTIRKNGSIVQDVVACREPFSTQPLSNLTDELFLLQSLRIIYYMDLGRSNYLPWTKERLYDWIKLSIGGINLDTSITGGNCCSQFNGRSYINLGARETFIPLNARFDQALTIALANIPFIVHEVRHLTGPGHVGCPGCPIAGNCDQTYDENNISSYGAAYYIDKAIYSGIINIGVSCLDTNLLTDFFGSGPTLGPNGIGAFFCNVKPPVVTPAIPWGPCQPGSIPYINPNGVTNAASFLATSTAPGGLISLFGSGLAVQSNSATNLPLPKSIDGSSLEINGQPAPLLFVNDDQINAQLPFDVPVGTITARVTANQNIGYTRFFLTRVAAPGIFEVNNHAIAQNEDGTLNSARTPAKAGSILTVYLTDLGGVDNPVPTGIPVPLSPLSRAINAGTVTIGGVSSDVLFMGLTPTFVGLAQVNVRIPAFLGGEYPIVVTLNGVASNAPLLYVK